jgi:hypothetical protein
LGLLAIYFVMRRKSVDKRSMYSARRSQIEHKVRAARQRTLTPHGHAEKPVDAPAAPAAAPSPFAAEPTFTPKQTAPTIKYQPYQPPPAPTPRPAPIEPDWTPGAAPTEPAKPIEPARTAAPVPAGTWSIVEEQKTGAPEPERKKTEKSAAQTSSSWQLASGEAPGDEAEQEVVKRPSGTLVAVAQYAILVVGLVMVLIGVLVMVANSKPS